MHVHVLYHALTAAEFQLKIGISALMKLINTVTHFHMFINIQVVSM